MTLSFAMLDGTCLAAEKLRFGRECPRNNVEKHILIFEDGCALIQNMSEAQPKLSIIILHSATFGAIARA